MAILFQDSSLSFNPVMAIGDQLTEALQTHRPIGRVGARAAALAMLDRVQIPGGGERFGTFAHQLSGGMRQRVLIAMALICKPALLIADEPTASLDAIVQQQIVRLIRNLCRETGTSVLLITHDLLLVHETADDVAVMFAGQIMERGRRAEILENPQHPYTLQLLAAFDPDAGFENQKRPHPDAIPSVNGCQFYARCPEGIDPCRTEKPTLVAISGTHSVACSRAPLEATLR